MTRYILIADSGSTKTDWILTSQDNGILQVNTTGINPVRDSQDAILRVLTEELLPRIPHPHQVEQAHFYGAGCIQPFCQAVSQSLSDILPRTEIHVGSDLLGAARALCGNEPGIACILGTGSNSCLYDGKEITLLHWDTSSATKAAERYSGARSWATCSRGCYLSHCSGSFSTTSISHNRT